MALECQNHTIAILGMGRLGCALSETFLAQNCRVVTVASEFSRRFGPDGIEIAESISGLNTQGPFALGILTIAPEKIARYHTLDEHFRVLKEFATSIGDAPIAIVSGKLPLPQIVQAIGGKPFVRFSCTCAIASTRSLCLVDADSDRTAKARLKLLLGEKDWKEVPRNLYDEEVKWLVASALQCAVMAVYESLLARNDVTTSEVLSPEEIILEAHRMIQARSGDAKSAFWLSCTPGGMTREAASQIFGTTVVESLLEYNQ